MQSSHMNSLIILFLTQMINPDQVRPGFLFIFYLHFFFFPFHIFILDYFLEWVEFAFHQQNLQPPWKSNSAHGWAEVGGGGVN